MRTPLIIPLIPTLPRYLIITPGLFFTLSLAVCALGFHKTVSSLFPHWSLCVCVCVCVCVIFFRLFNA